MHLKCLRLRNFQSFGSEPSTVYFDSLTFLIGPNGSGKTAVLRALSRMFAVEKRNRGVKSSDFHVTSDKQVSANLWIEADFGFSELLEDGESPAVPDHYAHLKLETPDSPPLIRIRLSAQIDIDGEIDEKLEYVTRADENNDPLECQPVSRFDRTKIQVHYIPARRDPSEHISFNATTLLGKLLRAADWTEERSKLAELADEVGINLLGVNPGVIAVTKRLQEDWKSLHKGAFYSDPNLAFENSDLEAVLRNLSVSFSPTHGDGSVSYSLLSDGQQSLLYLSLVLCAQAIFNDVLSGQATGFDAAKLRPPTFSMIVMEEPENSLSPHYLGRVVAALTKFASSASAQAAVATHAPSMLRRVSPEAIRYLRLNDQRETTIRSIVLPADDVEARKFVKEAVQAYPELYFSRLVVLGEGDSELIVLPRLLQAFKYGSDDASITVAPLGGRFVHHFWRLLRGLDIPHVTLLDLDTGRHQAGWGRIRYAFKQLREHDPASTVSEDVISKLPKWDDLCDFPHSSKRGTKAREWLEEKNQVFFSDPLDLDFSMITSFAQAYGITESELEPPDPDVISSVLGKSAKSVEMYSTEERMHFSVYHRIFKLSSKPVSHLFALSNLTDDELRDGAPASLLRMIKSIDKLMKDLPE
ncbi:ATP-dependent endonuclease [Pseudonocardia sp. TMWB2A]|uniref:ATP-dependent nuclease n=1 Tax=Pseudonocardia sp. TMWB2A TaxID=687430 RepID=UPI00307D32F9